MKRPSPKFSLALALIAAGLIVFANTGCHRRSRMRDQPPSPAPPPIAVPAPPTEVPKPPEPAPELGPSITPQEKARAEESANDLMNRTESNLKRASGKSLNATQKDLLERSSAFLRQARAAARTGDWARASNLAQKAFLLSEDLSRSLP